MSNLVDRWLANNNMKLMDEVVHDQALAGRNKKIYVDGRGSFGDIVKVAKAELVNAHMDKLLKKQHWKILKAKKINKHETNLKIEEFRMPGKTWEGKDVIWKGWLISPTDWTIVDQQTNAASYAVSFFGDIFVLYMFLFTMIC